MGFDFTLCAFLSFYLENIEKFIVLSFLRNQNSKINLRSSFKNQDRIFFEQEIKILIFSFHLNLWINIKKKQSFLKKKLAKRAFKVFKGF